MPTTKSGIGTPVTPPSQSLGVPVKVYPASSKIGHTRADIVEGPGKK